MHKKCPRFSWKFPVENPMAWLLQSIHKNSYRAFAHFFPFFTKYILVGDAPEITSGVFYLSQWEMFLYLQAAG